MKTKWKKVMVHVRAAIEEHEELKKKQPLSPSEKLKEKLEEAIEMEEFEEAAAIRDRIKEI